MPNKKEEALLAYMDYLSDDYLLLPRNTLQCKWLRNFSGYSIPLYFRFRSELAEGQYLIDDDWNIYLFYSTIDLADDFNCKHYQIQKGLRTLVKNGLVEVTREKKNFFEIGEGIQIYMLDAETHQRIKADFVKGKQDETK